MIHGIDVNQTTQGTIPIVTEPTGVIALVGISPIGVKDSLEWVANARQAVTKFGQSLPGFTIPQALEQIFTQKGGPVMVVNVFDADTMTAEVTSASHTVVNGRFKLQYAPIGGVIVLKNSGGTVTYTAGTDYTVDVFGNVTVLATITEGQSVRATYDRLNTSLVTGSAIIGAITAGTYTGMKLLQTARSKFGYDPGIIICPTYCELTAVATEMITQAESLDSIAMIDAPSGEPDLSNVLAERGLAGTWAGFQSASKNAYLFWPYLKRYDTATDATVLTPQSPYWAGIMSASDVSRGFWYSPSNQVIKGIVGVEYDLQGRTDDPSSDSNQLNAAGISTVIVSRGLRTWGNRSASYPSVTTSDNFINVQRVKMVIAEALRGSLMDFVDLPINLALIDSIRESVNVFLRGLIQKGALVSGSECLFDAEDNPPAQISNGQLVFQVVYFASTVAERITFNMYMDLNLLTVLTEQ